jgi:hypothetical protein
MKPWQIKIANYYFKLTERFTVMEWFFLLIFFVIFFTIIIGFIK